MQFPIALEIFKVRWVWEWEWEQEWVDLKELFQKERLEYLNQLFTS